MLVRPFNCFSEMSVHDRYLRVVHQSPLGDVVRSCACIRQMGILCRDSNRKTIISIRVPNGIHEYGIDDLRQIGEFWNLWCYGLNVALVDPNVKDEVTFMSAVGKHTGVNMRLFKNEHEALEWIKTIG